MILSAFPIDSMLITIKRAAREHLRSGSYVKGVQVVYPSCLPSQKAASESAARTTGLFFDLKNPRSVDVLADIDLADGDEATLSSYKQEFKTTVVDCLIGGQFFSGWSMRARATGIPT